MDGVTAVQTRITEIQTRFVYRTPAASGGWTSAASAAGLDGTSATPAYGPTGAKAPSSPPASCAP